MSGRTDLEASVMIAGFSCGISMLACFIAQEPYAFFPFSYIYPPSFPLGYKTDNRLAPNQHSSANEYRRA